MKTFICWRCLTFYVLIWLYGFSVSVAQTDYPKLLKDQMGEYNDKSYELLGDKLLSSRLFDDSQRARTLDKLVQLSSYRTRFKILHIHTFGEFYQYIGQNYSLSPAQSDRLEVHFNRVKENLESWLNYDNLNLQGVIELYELIDRSRDHFTYDGQVHIDDDGVSARYNRIGTFLSENAQQCVEKQKRCIESLLKFQNYADSLSYGK